MKTLTPPPDLSVATTQPQAVALPPAPQSFDIESVFRYAIEKGGGPETMTTLMNIRRELNSEAALKAFNEALTAFQAECPVIVKGKPVPTKGGDIAYKFAPIEEVERVIRPVEMKYGFSHTFDQDVESQPGWVIAKCVIKHSAGHADTKTVKLPLGSGTQIMSTTQIYASALTFANRRALANAYGLVLVGEDFDGGGKPRPTGPAAPKREPATGGLLKHQDTAKDAEAALPPQGGKVTLTAIWNLCKKHDASLVAGKTWDVINDWLQSSGVLNEGENLPKLAPARLVEVLTATDKLLNP